MSQYFSLLTSKLSVLWHLKRMGKFSTIALLLRRGTSKENPSAVRKYHVLPRTSSNITSLYRALVAHLSLGRMLIDWFFCFAIPGISWTPNNLLSHAAWDNEIDTRVVIHNRSYEQSVAAILSDETNRVRGSLRGNRWINRHWMECRRATKQ